MLGSILPYFEMDYLLRLFVSARCEAAEVDAAGYRTSPVIPRRPADFFPTLRYVLINNIGPTVDTIISEIRLR